MAEAKIPAMTLEQLTENLFVLKQMCDTLNIAIAGVAKAADVQADALNDLKVDEYIKWIETTLHPLVRKTNDLHREYAKQQSKEMKKEVKETVKKAKKATKKEK